MKINLFGILALMLVLSGGCHKAVAPEVKPKTSSIDTAKKTSTPFAGTWKIFYNQTTPVAECDGGPPDYQDTLGKGISQMKYDYFTQNDSLVILPNTWYYVYPGSGNAHASMSGLIHCANKMLYFDDSYWVINKFTDNELYLISPLFYVSYDCHMEVYLEQTFVKFKRVKSGGE